MIFRQFFAFLKSLGPYKPDAEKENALDSSLDLLRHHASEVVAASDRIAEAKDRADVRIALRSLGRAVGR